MAQLKDLIVAGSARLLGKTYFEDTVTINDTLEVDAIKADSIITPSLNSDGTDLTVGGSLTLTASGKYVTIGDGTDATSTATGVVRIKGGLGVTKSAYFGQNVTTAQGFIGNKLTLNNTATSGNGIYLYRTNTSDEALRINVDGSNGTITNTNETLQSLLNLVLEYKDTANSGAGAGSKTIEFKATSSGSQISANHLIADGNLQVNGNATIGNATSDTHTIKGNTTLSGDFIPGTTIAYGLGSTSKYWKNLYVGDGTAGAVSNTGTQTGSIVVNGGMSLSNDIAIKCENNDRAIKFIYGKSSSDGYSWQIKYSGTGESDANYLSIESSGTSGTYSPAVRFGLTSLNAAFGGNIYPLTVFDKESGLSSNPWKQVSSKAFYIYGKKESNNSTIAAGNFRVSTDGTTDTVGESLIAIGNGTASGTEGNARGSLYLYNTNTGYVKLTPGTDNTTKYTLYLPGATGQLVYHTNDTEIGGSLTPVYVNSGGKVTACTVSAKGDRWGVLTSIGSNGTMEVGKHINFHNTNDDTTDYSYRITTDTSLLTGSGGIKATTTMESGTTMTVGTNLTVKSNAYFANGTTYKIDSSGHAVFNNTTANGNLTVNGNTVLGNATTDTTTIKGAVSITYDGTAATGSAATALSNMKGAIKVLDGGIVTNKDVAAKSFYVHDKARMQYDTTNDYVYFTFN